MPIQNNELMKLLNEKKLSDIMTGFYNAVIVLENSKILQTNIPWDFDPFEYRGDTIQKQGMQKICSFLELLQLFAKDDTTFNEQFLKPVQIIAEMRQEWANSTNKRSADLVGWIFSISKPTKTSNYGGLQITVSIVIPELQTVMSLSIPKELVDKTSSKYFQFTKCQPIGLVNRIHQVKGASISKTDKDVLLSEFNFLFTAFNDIQLLGSSIEMENFCEIESQNSKVKQHMGFSFVSFAKVLDVQGSEITMQGLDEQAIISFTIPNHYYENVKMIDPKKMIGKYVRFFGVKWYNPNVESEIDLEVPEIFLMQEEKDSERLKIEDMIGRIRLRSHTSQFEIKQYLGKEIPLEDCIGLQNNSIYFRYSKSDDPICKSFMIATSAIRNLREKFKTSSPRITQEQVIDAKKMSKFGIMNVLKKSRPLYEILVDYQMQMDLNGEYDRDLSILRAGYPEEVVKKKIWHLKFLGIFEFNKNYEKITSNGKDILQLCMKDELDKSQSELGNMIKLEDSKIPPSILLKYLQNENSSRFSPLILNVDKKTSTEIYWSKENQDDKIAKNEYVNKRNDILDAMRSVTNSVPSQWISEELERKNKKIGAFVVNLFLSEIAKTGRIKQDGESWEYPIHARIYDLFQAFPDKRFNSDSIYKELVIPKLKNKEIEKYLKDFETTNTIFSINDEWTSTKDAYKKIIIIANEKTKECVLRILDEIQNVSKNDTVKDRYMTDTSAQHLDFDSVVDQVIEIFSDTGFLNLIEKYQLKIEQIIKEEINLMITNNVLVKLDGMLSKK